MKLPNDIAIRVTDIHKSFRIPRHQDDSIKHRIITAFEPKDKGVDIHEALRGITFDVKKGEFFGVIGRNGSGKSTLLKIISNIYTPTSGTTQHRGKLVAFIELGVGFNPQLSGRENVYLNGAMLGFSRKEIDAMYDDIVEFAELKNFMDLRLRNYSSGMKVRLAFSVAIRAQADILILDEVLAVGDAAFKRKCYNYFKNLKEAHKTIVLVSHNMGLIQEYCDRVILIEDGKIAFEGGPEGAAEEYNQLFGANINNVKNPDGPAIEMVDCTAKLVGESIHVEVTLRANANIDNVELMTRLTGEKKVLSGATTEQLGVDGGLDFKKDKDVTVTIDMENTVVAPHFYLAFIVRSRESGEQYGEWDHVVKIENKAEKSKFPILMRGSAKISQD